MKKIICIFFTLFFCACSVAPKKPSPLPSNTEPVLVEERTKLPLPVMLTAILLVLLAKDAGDSGGPISEEKNDARR